MRELTDDQDLVNAGLFHSIYGTEGFQAFTVSLDQRPKIKQLIGDRAEQICYGETNSPFVELKFELLQTWCPDWNLLIRK